MRDKRRLCHKNIILVSLAGIFLYSRTCFAYTRNINSHFWERFTQRIYPEQEWRPVRSVVQRLSCIKDGILERQAARTGAQVLMTECPLNTRCVSRNFCDSSGMVTVLRDNDLNFEADKRGFIACVDSSRNVLGVCCVDLETVLEGEGGPIRQDDVFTVSTMINMSRRVTPTTRAPKVSKRQENVSPPTAEDNSPPFVIINIQADNAELDGDIRRNKKVKTNLENGSKSRPLPDFLADNPFISNKDVRDDPAINLSPTDVMTILSMMQGSTSSQPSEPVFTTCPAATICVDRSRCDFNGVVSDQEVRLTPRLVNMQVALNKCTTSIRRQSSSKVCCRDPNFKSEADDYDDYGNVDYMNFDEVYMYNMTPTRKKQNFATNDKLRDNKRRRKKKRRRPSTNLELPRSESKQRLTRRKPNGVRESLDFFTNG